MIIIVAHGFTIDDQPTFGTLESYLVAKKVREHYEKLGQKPEVYFGAFDGSPSEENEKDWKLAIFPDGVYTGPLRTTVEEVTKSLTAWNSRHYGNLPRSVVYITDEAHSRRAKIVADKFFGRGKVSICLVPHYCTLDHLSAMGTYNGTAWKAFVLQAVWEPVFRVLPAWVLKTFFMKLGQPITH